MVYNGTVMNGNVVPEAGAELPDGAEVRVALAPASAAPSGEQRAEHRAGMAQVWQALQGLPESACFDDVVEEVYLLYKINRGLRQLDSGQGIPHEEARERFREWLE